MRGDLRRLSLTRRHLLIGAATIAANGLVAACGGTSSATNTLPPVPATTAATSVVPTSQPTATASTSVPPVAETFATPTGTPTTPLIVFTGDSIVYGTNLQRTETFPAQTIALLAPSKYDAVNLGIRGAMTSFLTDLAPGAVDPLYAASRSKNLVVVCIGSNDLSTGASGEQTYAKIVMFGQARRSVGFKVVILTILPRTGLLGAVTTERFETERQVLNARIRTNLASFADALADVGADPTIGAPGATANQEYYQSDGTHPTAKGHSITAGIVKAAILTL